MILYGVDKKSNPYDYAVVWLYGTIWMLHGNFYLKIELNGTKITAAKPKLECIDQ